MFNNDADECLQFLEDKYKKIIQIDKMCKSILRYIITALLSIPCKEFNAYIKGVKDDVNSSAG